MDRKFGVGKSNERVKRPNLGSGRHCRRENFGTERPGRMHQGLSAVQTQAPRDAGQGVVRNREDDQVDGVDERRRFCECSRSGHVRLESCAPLGVAGRDGPDGPTGPRQRRSEGRADGATSDNPDDRWIARGRMSVGMGVIVGLAVAVHVVVGMPAVGRRVQVDASIRELPQRLIDARRSWIGLIPRPGSHRQARAGCFGRARYACIHRV